MNYYLPIDYDMAIELLKSNKLSIWTKATKNNVVGYSVTLDNIHKYKKCQLEIGKKYKHLLSKLGRLFYA